MFILITIQMFLLILVVGMGILTFTRELKFNLEVKSSFTANAGSKVENQFENIRVHCA